jgi:hypothetical protein
LAPYGRRKNRTDFGIRPLPIRAQSRLPIRYVRISSLGQCEALRPTRLPFTALERAVIVELHRFFRPELIGRFDEKIVFKPLPPEVQREIGSIAICNELDRFNDRGFNLTISEEPL